MPDDRDHATLDHEHTESALAALLRDAHHYGLDDADVDAFHRGLGDESADLAAYAGVKAGAW